MAGSVHKDKKSGKWYYMLELGTFNGKRKQKKKSGFKTKKEASTALVEAENEFNKGTFIEPTKSLYSDYLNDWFKGKKTKIAKQTATVYEHHINTKIIPKLGNIPLAKLTPLHLDNFVNELVAEGLASATIKKSFEVIRSSLCYARDLEIVNRNVAEKIKLPSNPKQEMKVWNEDEFNQFIKVAKKDTSNYYIVFYLALMTGMRQGEILGLRWSDIDFENEILIIQQTLSHDGKEFLKGGKTKSSRRSIHLSTQTLETLKKHKKTILENKLKLGSAYIDFDLVCCTETGTPLNPSNIRRKLNALIKIAEVPKIRFHDLRHTHATMLLLKGVNIKVIQERLGHSNIKVTLDVYSHVLPTMQSEALKKLDSLISI
ncbi:tyrosine-type recombinase/integrase [Cytobacillus praedii]|uniref:Site-specific integrase n=1 Tax=Cytobacillus praedii TaxID=1742358 RepID=A0A4R1ALC5_9BACI|nr:site-specific integrase [Cytobacillus praedii]TCJ00481.1 site-specific integrase [Cytobacillus praedii]